RPPLRLLAPRRRGPGLRRARRGQRPRAARVVPPRRGRERALVGRQPARAAPRPRGLPAGARAAPARRAARRGAGRRAWPRAVLARAGGPCRGRWRGAEPVGGAPLLQGVSLSGSARLADAVDVGSSRSPRPTQGVVLEPVSSVAVRT